MEKNIIPICFAIDDAYTPFLAVALQSLIDNASKEYNYCIKVLHTNVKEEHMKQIKKYENEYVNIEFVDLNYYLEKVKDKLYTRDYYTNTTYFRLFLPELYPQYDKILYLDSDITIVGDISELYNTDITEYEYAAVKEKYGSVFIWPDYINAGMLLLNMKKIKETGLLEKSRELIKNRKLLFADQSAIYYSTTKKLLLPRIYNEQSKFNKEDTVICHFCKRLLWRPYPHTENFKQWQIEEVHKILKCHAFDKDLEEYVELKKQYESRKGEKINE